MIFLKISIQERQAALTARQMVVNDIALKNALATEPNQVVSNSTQTSKISIPLNVVPMLNVRRIPPRIVMPQIPIPKKDEFYEKNYMYRNYTALGDLLKKYNQKMMFLHVEKERAKEIKDLNKNQAEKGKSLNFGTSSIVNIRQVTRH